MNNREKDDLSVLKYTWYKKAEYKINIKSYLTLGGGKANQTEIEEDWTVLPGEYNHITINSSLQRYIKSDKQMRPYYEILEKINKATDVLELFLNTDKSVLEITNKKEILNKWDEIKKDLRFFELIKNNFEVFINIYNNEFNKIDQNIKLNFLYQIMFYPLPVFRGGSYIDEIPVRTTLSTLFPGEKLRYKSQHKITRNDKGEYLVKLEGRGENGQSQFKNVYKDKYQKILGSSLDYNYFIEGEYIYNEDSILSEIMFHVKEELNEKMFYVCRYHIKLNKQ
ncbi:hypothetical protein M2347_003284 [Chryseobacterium sp. H1D6B]|uniref:hypothetical protein n=1 Tax=Chryseobacterium sp. H1D6B TaxID=2940588 RepID=UPI0015CDC4F3|nr:hypothetical protein [Chryseobacterium sp. H1D6B]MDH6253557.1 hypothetical protein [Chryseobacterium sp. H1D6B]